jgi:hypothetical protein
MNYKLYNYLRLIGIPASEATEIASQSQAAVDIYEQKQAVDRNRRGNFAKVIGLKDEFKLVSQS